MQDFGYQYKKRVHRSGYTRFFMIPLKGIVYSKLYNFLSKRPNIPGLQGVTHSLAEHYVTPKSSVSLEDPSE